MIAEEPLVTALYNYKANDGEEISIKRGDQLYLLEQYDDGWCLARKGSKTGLVPNNYLREYPMENKSNTGSKSKQKKKKSITGSDADTLKQLREEAEAKVNALSMALKSTQNEDSNLPVESPIKQRQNDDGEQGYSESKSRTNTMTKAKSTLTLSHNASRPAVDKGQQIILEPKSIKFISEIISERINQELAVRDSRLMDKVKTMISASTSMPSPAIRSSLDPDGSENEMAAMEEQSRHSLPPGANIPSPHRQRQHHGNFDPYTPGKSSQKKSKIPIRSGLPKLTPNPASAPINRNSSGSDKLQASPLIRPTPASASKLPVLQVQKASHHRKRSAGNDRLSGREEANLPDNIHGGTPNYAYTPISHNNGGGGGANNNNMVIEPSVDGIQYANCRSKVYGPSFPIEAPDSLPGAKLALHHIYGYDGDVNRHGNAMKGKNVVWVDARRVMYPAAAVVVVQEVGGDRRQGFFCGHSDDVKCVAVHTPDDNMSPTLAASGQMGKDCTVLVWDISKVKRGMCLNRHLAKLKPAAGVRGVCGVEFSGDGKFLLAIGIDESRLIMIFDWREGTLVASSKVGHSDVNQVRFNPYLYTPMQPSNDLESCRGCYTLVSYGGKQVKFWTFKEFYAQGNAGLEQISNFKGRPLKPRKGEEKLTLQYALEGNLGVLPSKASNTPDITSVLIVNDDLDDGNTAAGVPTNPKSRLFFGTSAGSLYIWQQLEEGESIKRGRKKSKVAGSKQHPHFPGIGGLGFGWQPHGKLVSVVMELHDTAITDMDYIRLNPYNDGMPVAGADPSYFVERIISSSIDGIINVWLLNRHETSNSLPLDHLGYLELNKEYARTVCWDDTGYAAVLGTAENSVLLLSYDEEEIIDGGDAGAGGGDQEESIRPKIAIDVLTQSHNGKVRKLAVNPVITTMIASISSDKIVRLWDFRERALLTCFILPDAATAVAFTTDGQGLALGNEKGEFAIYECDELGGVTGNYPCHFTPNDFIGAHWRMVFKRSLAKNENGQQSPKRPKGGSNKNKSEVLEIKFSPNGEIVAIGCRDKLIHLLTAKSSYKHIAVCRGHSAAIRSIDFSVDSALLQTSDAAREVMFWETGRGQRILNAAIFRDATWATASSVYGYNVQGVFNNNEGVSAAADGDINCVDRSADGQWLVTGGSATVHNAIKLFNYPCLSDAMPSFHGGHTSPVLDVKFLSSSAVSADGGDGGTEVATAGGNDSCMFQWRLLEYQTPRPK